MKLAVLAPAILLSNFAVFQAEGKLTLVCFVPSTKRVPVMALTLSL